MEIDCNKATHQELLDFIRDYGQAAKHAMLAGCDIVNVHGAHGQLPALLFSKIFNKRTDEYGAQSFESRCRFANDLLTEIRNQVGNKVAIEYRLSCLDMLPGSPPLEEVIEFAKAIQDKIDILLISRGSIAINKFTPYVFPPMYMDHGINIEYAAEFKKALNIPVGVVGAVTLEQGEEAVAAGKVDTIALCRQLIADPDCVNKAARGQEDEIRHCIRCNTCISRSHFGLKPPRCAVNPMFHRGQDYAYMPPAKKKKKVLIVGGGIAGIQAARTASERGHEVVLYEKSSQLGGCVRGASIAPFKHDMGIYLEYAIRQLHADDNIKVRMCKEVTPEIIRKEAPDALVIALGNVPIIPKVTCKNPDRVVWVGDVDNGKAQVGQRLLIVGAGLTGCETAYRFLQLGREVVTIDMAKREDIAMGTSPINTYALFNLLSEYNFDLRCETKLVDVTDDDVIVSKEGIEEKLKVDTVILSLGNRPNEALVKSFTDLVPEYYLVGDCNGEPGSVWNSITSAYDAAMII
jgi:NADPH-dependent 2,4-dienoyl-CoA reductase/sulfur reductase-like enzyme